MKKVMLGLIVLMAFSLSTEASTVTTVKHESTTTFTTPPNGRYYVGSFHRRVPRYAQRVVVNNNVYFRSQGVYFQPTRRGFVVVQPPRAYRQAPRHRNGNGRGYNQGYNRGYNQGYGGNRGNNNYRYRNNNQYRGGCRR